MRFDKEEDPSEGVRGGALECPEETVEQWLTFHYACTKSGVGGADGHFSGFARGSDSH